MTYLNDVHGIIIGGIQDYIVDEVVYDRNDNLIQTSEIQTNREYKVGIARSHGAHKIASFLREYGADVEVLDFAFSWELSELKDLWKSRYNSKTLFFCVSTAFRCSSGPLWMFVEWLRENYPHIHTIGGTQSIDKLLPYKLDWYVFGYGEYAMLELVKCLKDDTNTGKLKYYTVGPKRIINAQKEYKAFPKRKLSMSYEDRDFIKNWETLPLEFSRGCIFECAFCSYPILGVRGDHSRDENDLYNELLENYNRWGTTCYNLSDETVNDYHEKLERYAKVIKKLPFKLRLGGYARADILVSRKKSWDTYVEMGFMNHFYGVESLHHPSVKAVGKGMDSGKLKDGLLEWKEYAYKNSDFYAGYISLIAGLPYETIDTLNEGVAWLKKHWKDNFAAMGNLNINLPDYEGIYKNVLQDLNDLSLIERDPEKYGYKVERKSVPSTDYKQQDLVKDFEVAWTNNVGLSSKDVAEWFKGAGSLGLICTGTIPQWAGGEFLVDERFNYLDLNLKTEKREELKSLSISFLTPTVGTNFPDELLKHPKPQEKIYKHLRTGGETYLTDGKVDHTLKMNEFFKKVESNMIEVDGIKFASAGSHLMKKSNDKKADFIKQYKMGKLNA